MASMKRTLGGKQYDTETARQIGQYPSLNCTETLYITKSRQFFLHGVGDAKTPYAKKTPDGFVPGEDIIPMTEKGAQTWYEVHFGPNTWNAVMSAVDEGTVTITFRIPPSVKERFDNRKDARGMSAGQYLDHLLNLDE